MIEQARPPAVLVVYEDGCPELERVARAVAERLDRPPRTVRLRAASEAAIPELLASGLLLLGAENPRPPSYAELALALKCMCLAGRKAAYFGATGAAVAGLKDMCADTEIRAARADLVGRRLEGPAVAAWLRSIE